MGFIFALVFAVLGVAAGFLGIGVFVHSESAIQEIVGAVLLGVSATCFTVTVLASIESSLSDFREKFATSVQLLIAHAKVAAEKNQEQLEELIAAVEHVGADRKRPHEQVPTADGAPPIAARAGDGAVAPDGALRIVCPGCSKPLNVNAKLAGRERKCPACGAAFRVPAAV